MMLTQIEDVLIGVLIVPGDWELTLKNSLGFRSLYEDGLIQNNGGRMGLTDLGYRVIASADRAAALNMISELLTTWHCPRQPKI
jgi:hypothetical protein